MIKDFHAVEGNKHALYEQISEMISENESGARVSAKPWKESRSLSQNALYWKWLQEISTQAKVSGETFDKDVWHEYFKRYYCPRQIMNLPAGDPIFVRSTTRLDTGDMHHYLSKIERWAADKGFNLTIPDNCEYRQLQERQEQ